MENQKKSPTKRVRVVVYDKVRKAFLAVINNRVTPGALTVLLPGGDFADGETAAEAVSRHLLEEVGLSISATDVRFLTVRTYEFDCPDGGTDTVQLSFFGVASDGGVPRNMHPDGVVSVSWLTLAEVERFIAAGDWKIQLGVLDAVKIALKADSEGAREVARDDTPPVKAQALPYEKD